MPAAWLAQWWKELLHTARSNAASAEGSTEPGPRDAQHPPGRIDAAQLGRRIPGGQEREH